MSIEVEAHSDPEPAPVHVQEAHVRHPTPGVLPQDTTPPSTDELLKALDEQVKKALAPFENNTMDANRIEVMKLKLSQLTYVSSVGVSVDNGSCEVCIQVFCQGASSSIKAKFPAKALPNVVESEDPKPPAMLGKGMSGDDKKATEPYAEAPVAAERKYPRKPD